MKVTTWGTRGSISLFSPDMLRYGGNTTCYEVSSDCIPSNMVLAFDSGTGLVFLSKKYIATRPVLTVLQTHDHWDHLMGMSMAAHAHAEHASVNIYGAPEGGDGPRQSMEDLFSRRHFPRRFGQIEHRFKCKSIEDPASQVFVIHPKAGVHLLSKARYLKAVGAGKQLQLGDQRHEVAECLVITMLKSEHPDYAISYRIVENPTGKSCVILTDHERQAAHSKDLLDHVRSVDLLIQDAQYTQETHDTQTAGFGHGTPEYCAELAIRAGVKKLLLTHHDPMAADADIDRNVRTAQQFSMTGIEPRELEIGAARDFMEINL